jgi:hypothetical protein
LALVQTIDVHQKIVEGKDAPLFELELWCPNAFLKGSTYVTPEGLFRFWVNAKNILEWV